MTTPSDHDDTSGRSASASGRPSDDNAADSSTAGKVDLGKTADEPFDPYRFGRPDHPIPPEYAPPGYVPDAAPPASGPPPPPGTPPGGPYPYGAPPYGQSPYPQVPYGQGQYPPGQSPYGQNSYGQAPYPVPPAQYGAHQPQGGSNGKAVTSMVLGILSIVLCWLTFFDLALIIPAVVFGILGLAQARARNGIGKNLAIAGLICAVVGSVLAITVTVLYVRAADKCGGTSQAGESGFNECVQDHFVSGRELERR